MWPLRHHWLGPLPRALNAIDVPSGDGDAANSLVKRSALTGIGMPPVARTRKMSLTGDLAVELAEK